MSGVELLGIFGHVRTLDSSKQARTICFLNWINILVSFGLIVPCNLLYYRFIRRNISHFSVHSGQTYIFLSHVNHVSRRDDKTEANIFTLVSYATNSTDCKILRGLKRTQFFTEKKHAFTYSVPCFMYRIRSKINATKSTSSSSAVGRHLFLYNT